MDMKKIILFSLILIGCDKKTTAPSSTVQTQTTQTVTKVWCFYQTNFGGHAFLYCAKTEQEYQTKVNQYNGLQFVVETKTNCNDCQ